MSAYGPRASIDRIGTAEELPDGNWLVQNWVFNARHDPRVAPYTYDADGKLIAIAGWRPEELRDIVDAKIDLSMLPVADRPL